jgi:membrane protein
MRHLWYALRAATRHDALMLAKSASYSAVVSLFPALMVLVFLLGLNPGTEGISHAMNSLVESLLPPNAVPLILNYLSTQQHTPHSAIFLSWTGLVSFVGAQGILLTLMEGFRRAFSINRHEVKRWRERMKAILLVPLATVPMAAATVLIVYGHQIEEWTTMHSIDELRDTVVFGWRMLRWAIALLCSVTVLMMIYQYGIPMRHKWRQLLPGAALATAFWFGATLLFGFYVGHYAHYSQVYGQLGAGIALLFWLYMVAYSVLVGAEFNAQHKRPDGPAES